MPSSTTTRYSVSRARSCIKCRQKKAKCDRKSPCRSCLDSGLECLYTNATSSNQAPDRGSEEIINFEPIDAEPPETVTNLGNGTDVRYRSTLLGSVPLATDVTRLHPSIPHIWLLWTIYLENVNPLYRIFHAHSFQKDILKGVQNLQYRASVISYLGRIAKICQSRSRS